MAATWAEEEMQGVDLNDKRLNERLTQVLADLGARPTASIPAACGGHTETQAAYRLFDNVKTTPGKVLAPHREQTLKRIAAQPVVLLVQDTTELDLTRPQQQIFGAGSLDGSARCGAFLHPLVAFSTDGTPLGTCWAKMWTREAPRAATADEKKRRQKAAPIEEKESHRWVEGLREARQVAEESPGVKCVCIADSEADIFEVFGEPRGAASVEWIVRACQDRALESAAESNEDSARLMREAVESQPVLFTKVITVRGRQQPKIACDQRGRRQPRKTRQAEVEVRAATVTLRPPPRPGRELAAVTIRVIQVREINPPDDDVPVEWLLNTTLPIATVEQVREVIHYYTVRFMIEVFFRVLKSGCRVEERRFEHLHRLLPCVAVYLIVAWRTLMICRLGQKCPDLPCEALFEPAEWKSVWMAVRRTRPPQEVPKLGEVVRLVAQLGGYMNYPNRTDPPGAQTVWLGLQRMKDLADGWTLFGPGASERQNNRK